MKKQPPCVKIMPQPKDLPLALEDLTTSPSLKSLPCGSNLLLKNAKEKMDLCK